MSQPRFLVPFATFLISLLVTSGVQGQFGPPGFGGGSQEEDPVKTSARASHTALPQGGDLIVTVIADIRDGWKIWTNDRPIPADLTQFSGAILTEVSVADPLPEGVQIHLPFAQWPEQFDRATMDMGEGPQLFAVFEHRMVLHVPITIDEDAPIGRARIRLRLTYQPCDATTCLPPTDEIVSVNVEILELGAAATTNPAAEELLASFDPRIFADIRAGVDAPAADERAAESGTEPEAAGERVLSRPSVFGFTIPTADSFGGLLIVAILAAIGGFLLNLTPCVLPVLPIKIMTLSKHAETPARTLVLGLWMAFGVVFFWVALGIPAAFVSGMTDPSRLFGIWWLTFSIGLLIALMGVGIMGMFTINLPGAVYAVNPRADSAWGSFLFGVMTGVLGLPCFGFVAGALLAGAATLPWQNIMIIFGALGIGMAAPYLVLSTKPALVDRIPRTGPASDLVKQVMGLLLIAAALYFIGSGLMTLVTEKPWLGKQLHFWGIAVVACISGLWLIIRTWSITKSAGKRAAFAVIGVIIGGIALSFAMSSTEAERRAYEARAAALALAPDAYITAGWNSFSFDRLAAARRDGKVVILDFTASWCINCQVLKRTILDVNPVRELLTADDTVAMTVDLSSRTAPGWTKMEELRQTGIPLLLIYAGDDENFWLENAYTSGMVVEAITNARQRIAAARAGSDTVAAR